MFYCLSGSMAKIYPALIVNALDPDVVSRSVLVSRAMCLVSFADAKLLLIKYGVQAEDVVTVAIGPSGSRDLEITITSSEAMTTFCDAGPKLYWVSTFSVVRDTISRFWKPGCTGFRSMSKILCLIKSLKGSGVTKWHQNRESRGG